MKALITLVLFLPILSFCGCSDVSPDAVEQNAIIIGVGSRELYYPEKE